MRSELETVAVLIVEKEPQYREELIRIVSNGPFDIGGASSCLDDIDNLPTTRPVQLLLGACEDPSATLRDAVAFKRRCAGGRVVVLAKEYDAQEALTFFRAGVDAYLAKLPSQDALLKSLELAMHNEMLLVTVQSSDTEKLLEFKPPDAQTDRSDAQTSRSDLAMAIEEPESRVEESKIPRLSTRERAILDCIYAGHSNKVIARGNGIAEATVKVHVKSILRKIRVVNRTQAAIWAARNQDGAEGVAPKGRLI